MFSRSYGARCSALHSGAASRAFELFQCEQNKSIAKLNSVKSKWLMAFFVVSHFYFCDYFATYHLKNIFSVAFFSSQTVPHLLPSVNPSGFVFGMVGRILFVFFRPPPGKVRNQAKPCAHSPHAVRSESGVAVAWWSRPDEPAALNLPRTKGILLRKNRKP